MRRSKNIVSNFHQAFTLIELLIVVMIIAILAAIAVPNFLEAQARAKVSRAKSDMRTEATALGTFYVDHNRYPEDYGTDEMRSWAMLTSPISYLSSVPLDIFPMDNHPAHSALTRLPFAYMNPKSLSGWGEAVNWNLYYGVVSAGPDGVAQWGQQATPFFWTYLYKPEEVNTPAMVYDPTNGTVSDGDLIMTNLGFSPKG